MGVSGPTKSLNWPPFPGGVRGGGGENKTKNNK